MIRLLAREMHVGFSDRILRRFNQQKWLLLMLVVQVLCLWLWKLTWPQATTIDLSFVVPQVEVQPWETVIAGFEKSHPHIRIHLVTDRDTDYTTDQRKAIYTADFQANVAQYDLVYMDMVWPFQFAASLRDLTPYVDRDQMALSGFLPSELEAGQLDGRLYRIPMRSGIGLLYYRKDLLAQVPKTFTELSQVVDTLKPSIGYVWQGNRYEGLVVNFVEVLGGLGGTWITPETGQVGLDTPMAIKAATLLQQLVEQGISPDEVITYTEQDSQQQFRAGQTVFLRGWSSFWAKLQKSKLAGKVAIAPPFSFTDRPGTGCRGGWGFGIPQNSAHPDEAWEAIQYLTSETAQKQFVLASGFLPSRSALFQDPDILTEHPHMPKMLDYLENASVFRPSIQEYGAASEILQSALSDILRGQQPVESAMQQAQIETEKVLKSPNQGG